MKQVAAKAPPTGVRDTRGRGFSRDEFLLSPLLQRAQPFDHIAQVHVQLVPLVGLGQRHVDLGQLVFQPLGKLAVGAALGAGRQAGTHMSTRGMQAS